MCFCRPVFPKTLQKPVVLVALRLVLGAGEDEKGLLPLLTPEDDATVKLTSSYSRSKGPHELVQIILKESSYASTVRAASVIENHFLKIFKLLKTAFFHGPKGGSDRTAKGEASAVAAPGA